MSNRLFLSRPTSLLVNRNSWVTCINCPINKENMKYRPLPKILTIQESDIEGLGLFATKDIKKNTNLGMMHYISEFSEVIRTPLGGFINHSNKPNCIKEKEDLIYEERVYLITNRLIKKGEELTVKYTMYKV
jgi:SET domain-containing protein